MPSTLFGVCHWFSFLFSEKIARLISIDVDSAKKTFFNYTFIRIPQRFMLVRIFEHQRFSMTPEREKQTDRETNRETHREIERQTDRQTEREKESKRNKNRERTNKKHEHSKQTNSQRHKTDRCHYIFLVKKITSFGRTGLTTSLFKINQHLI